MSYYNERGYLRLLADILKYGAVREDRTGTGTLSVFGPEVLHFDLSGGEFPLFTTKKMARKSILAETLWFTQGRYDLESLRADGCNWWDDWEKEDGSLGRVYGAQLRHWLRPDGTEVDQLAQAIESIKADPYSRRHVMTMWNPGELEDMALPPCHGALIQFYVGEYGLSCQVNIRSSDTFLGLPTNIAGYALLTYMVAHLTGYDADYLHVVLGDAHIYSNHVEQVRTQLERTPYPPPLLTFARKVTDIDDFKMDDFILSEYTHYPAIKAPISV